MNALQYLQEKAGAGRRRLKLRKALAIVAFYAILFLIVLVIGFFGLQLVTELLRP